MPLRRFVCSIVDYYAIILCPLCWITARSSGVIPKTRGEDAGDSTFPTNRFLVVEYR